MTRVTSGLRADPFDSRWESRVDVWYLPETRSSSRRCRSGDLESGVVFRVFREPGSSSVVGQIGSCICARSIESRRPLYSGRCEAIVVERISGVVRWVVLFRKVRQMGTFQKFGVCDR